jgi:hypothetical protein
LFARLDAPAKPPVNCKIRVRSREIHSAIYTS